MNYIAHTREYCLSGIEARTADLNSLTQIVLRWLESNNSRSNRLVSYINPHVFNVAMEDADVSSCLEKSDLVCIDGVGVKLALLLSKRQNLPRVVAEHLFNNLLEKLDRPVDAILVGASAEEAVLAATSLAQYNSNLQISATLDGFASLADYRKFFKEHSSVQLVLIGAGTPKSENIALSALRECSASVIMHIGAGTIKTWAGTKRRGPAVMSSLGLEWLHRIVFEPHTRSRYTLGAWIFARNLMRDKPAVAQTQIKRDQS